MQSLYPPSTATHGGDLAHLAGDPGNLASVQQSMASTANNNTNSTYPTNGATPMPAGLRLASPAQGVNQSTGPGGGRGGQQATATAPRKRKSPPSPPVPGQQPLQQPQANNNGQGGIVPAQTQHLPLLHAPPGHFANYPPASEYAAAALPLPNGNVAANMIAAIANAAQQGGNAEQQAQAANDSDSGGAGNKGRALSQSKRAEQNRKAQRAFRERRDQHVKNLESRSQLLDAALSSADEANRRWEECRASVETLRIENTQLRAEVAGLRAENASLHAALTSSGASYAQQQQIMHDAAAAAKEMIAANGGERGDKQGDNANKAK
jgi:hypothetical protein